MEFLNFIAYNLLNYFMEALAALDGANQAGNAEERNNHLRKLGKSLIAVGAFNEVVWLTSGRVLQLGRLVAYPFNICAIISAIICKEHFLYFTGLAGISVGMILLNSSNPCEYHTLAKVTVFASAFGVVFAMAIFVTA